MSASALAAGAIHTTTPNKVATPLPPLNPAKPGKYNNERRNAQTNFEVNEAWAAVRIYWNKPEPLLRSL